MKIKAIETFGVTLPFRFSFGHSLATRADSTNLIVRVTLEDGTQGFGEAVPRGYVTGEDIQQARQAVEITYAPMFAGLDVSRLDDVEQALKGTFQELGLDHKQQGASFCAVELAIIDATTKFHRMPATEWFGPPLTNAITYGGVVPFGGKKALLAMLLAYRLTGFTTVKIKVGKSLEEDIAAVALARKIMGPNATIRVDANCAWDVDQTLRAASAFRPYNVASYEQPVPADKLDWLKKITLSLEEQVVADESLCTLSQAQHLADQHICNAFNIRLSKAGGWLAAQAMVNIAKKHGIKCHLGAQVGESGILSAAARNFALCNPKFENYEGSMNGVLLQRDLTHENLTVSLGGQANLNYIGKQKFGFGFSIGEGTLEALGAGEHPALKEEVSAAY